MQLFIRLNQVRKRRPALPVVCAAGGFTLIEVVLASALGLMLMLALYEGLLFCRRSAANIRYHLAADAVAFDTVWDVFNRKTDWFDSNVGAGISEWKALPAERSTAFISEPGRAPSFFLQIDPVFSGSSPPHWTITVDVQWPITSGAWRRLPQRFVVDRYRVDRNLSRTGP